MTQFPCQEWSAAGIIIPNQCLVQTGFSHTVPVVCFKTAIFSMLIWTYFSSCYLLWFDINVRLSYSLLSSGQALPTLLRSGQAISLVIHLEVDVEDACPLLKREWAVMPVHFLEENTLIVLSYMYIKYMHD